MKPISLTILLLLAALSLGAQPTVGWTTTTYATGLGYSTLHKDPIAGGMIILGKVSGASGIFATDAFEYSMATGTGTRIVGTGSLVDTCPVDLPASYGGANPGGLPNRPGDRHPVNQQAVDTRRGLFWIGGGISRCSSFVTASGFSISGTTATAGATLFPVDGSWSGARVYIPGSGNCPTAGSYCTISSVSSGTTLTFTAPGPGTLPGSYQMLFVDVGNGGGNAGIWQDMYYLTLNANPTADTWTRVTPAHYPLTISGGSYYYQGSWAYDSDDDCLFQVEGTHLFRYCSTIGNSPSGLSAAQVAAGVATGDDWTLESVGAPGDSIYSGFVYDPIRKLLWKVGGYSASSQDTWAYNPGGVTRFGIASHTWQQFCTTGCTNPPGESTNMSEVSAVAYDSRRGTLLYHHTNDLGGAHNPQDYEFNPASGTTGVWTLLAVSPAGSSNTNGVQIEYDPVSNKLVSSGTDGTWQATLTDGSSFSTTLTIQESLFDGDLTGFHSATPGSGGVMRNSDPLCMGVPIADSVALTSTANLSLAGLGPAQFRILGNWPSGHAKWVKACGILPGMTGGSTQQAVLSNSAITGVSCGTTTLPNGSDTTCNGYGGSNMAALAGGVITVNTGAMTATIKASGNYNVVDSVVINGTSVVSTSSSQLRGLVLTGPDPTSGTTQGKVTCSPDVGGSTCATVYSSANDSLSSCVIEENGPVLAVVRCIGTHKDSSGNPYMQFTARQYFYAGKTIMPLKVVLRNANYDTSTTPSPDCPSLSGGVCHGGSFDTAFKGFRSYELRIGPNASAPFTYTIATNSTNQTGTVTGAAYIYQGYSRWLSKYAVGGAYCDDAGAGYAGGATACITSRNGPSDLGFVASNNSSTIASGNQTVAIGGWADEQTGGGIGIELGIDEMSAQWPSSLEFNSSGTDVRVGLFSQHNGDISGTPKNPYMGWPLWTTWDVFLQFHAAALASPQNDFLKYQAPLLARPPITYTNNSSVFPYPLVDPTIEDNYAMNLFNTATPRTSVSQANFCRTATGTAATSQCSPDRSGVRAAQASALDMGIPRLWDWSSGGGLNQSESRWYDMLKFFQRGYTGRYLQAKYFYRFQADLYNPHADGPGGPSDSTVNGFNWRSRQHYTEVNTVGQPTLWNATNLNYGKHFGGSYDGSTQWRDYLHDHWYGMGDYYLTSGDEFFKEAITPYKNWYLDTAAVQYGFGPTNPEGQPKSTTGITRAYGVYMLGAARLTDYLKAIGDSDATGILANAETLYNTYVNHTGCSGGIRPGGSSMTYYPAGCTAPNLDGSNTSNDSFGVSLQRGFHEANRGSAWCPAPDNGGAGITGNMTTSSTSVTLGSGLVAAMFGKPLITYSSSGSVSYSGTLYFPYSGSTMPSATEATVQVAAPQAMTISGLNIQPTAAPGAGNSLIFTWRKNGVSQAVTCTLSGAGAYSCTDSTNSFQVAQGDLLDIQVTLVGAPAPSFVTIKNQIYFMYARIGTEVMAICAANTATDTLSLGLSSCPNADGRGVNGTTAASHNIADWIHTNTSGLVGNYRIQQPFQQAILVDGLLALRHTEGSTWTQYNRSLDLAYGIARNNFSEGYRDDGNVHWTNGITANSGSFYNGFDYDQTIDFPSKCPAETTFDTQGNPLYGPGNSSTVPGTVTGALYDNNATPQGGNTLYFAFYAMAAAIGDISWQRQFNTVYERESLGLTAWPTDYGALPTANLIYLLNNPPVNQLQEVAFTATDLGSGNYQLQFTLPAGTCTNDPQCLRIKWSPRAIQKTVGMADNLLGFDSLNTQMFTLDPNANATWFGSNNAELTSTVPTPTPGAAMNVTVATATTGLSSAANSVNFSVKAMFPAACTITTISLPTATVGQSYSQTATQGGCASGTWTVANGSLPAWAALNGATGAITGTVSGSAGTATFTLAYGTATSGSLSITTNLAPSVTINALPVGTQGAAYAVQSISTSGGTAPVTCVANSGVPAGMTVHSGCTIDGTPSVSGSFTVNVTATDANSISSSPHNISFTINPNGAPSGGSSLSGNVKASGNAIVK